MVSKILMHLADIRCQADNDCDHGRARTGGRLGARHSAIMKAPGAAFYPNAVICGKCSDVRCSRRTVHQVITPLIIAYPTGTHKCTHLPASRMQLLSRGLQPQIRRRHRSHECERYHPRHAYSTCRTPQAGPLSNNPLALKLLPGQTVAR
jgi:hypothetical protein